MDKSLIDNQGVITTLLVLMFLLSGINKIYTFGDTVNSLKQKVQYNFSDELYKLAILIVIALEIIAPIIVIYYSITGKRRTEAYYSVIGLIAFTIIATIIYHFPDFSNYKKSIPFWANISLLGGLLLLLKTTIKEN